MIMTINIHYDMHGTLLQREDENYARQDRVSAITPTSYKERVYYNNKSLGTFIYSFSYLCRCVRWMMSREEPNSLLIFSVSMAVVK